MHGVSHANGGQHRRWDVSNNLFYRRCRFRYSPYETHFLIAILLKGTISVKKCLSGDGQICIDSDESAIKGAMAYAKKRKTTVMVGRGGLKGRASSEASAGLPPDPGFIGVKLNSNGIPERVYSSED